jgi:hypothetical protein
LNMKMMVVVVVPVAIETRTIVRRKHLLRLVLLSTRTPMTMMVVPSVVGGPIGKGASYIDCDLVDHNTCIECPRLPIEDAAGTETGTA